MSSNSKETDGKYEKIKVDLIEIGLEQARQRSVDKDVDELAANIDRLGLINPIMVFRHEDKYELIDGQRRLLAVKKLGWEEIEAKVLDRPPKDPIIAKAVSFSENFLRSDMVRRDIVDVCTALYNRYGTMKAAAEELGLPYHKIRQYVLYDRLPEELKKLVDEKKASLDIALKATDVATSQEGTVDVERAVNLVQEMKMLQPDQVKILAQLAEEKPSASTEEIIEEAKKPPKIIRLEVTLALRHYESLKKIAGDQGVTEGEAAARGIIEWLTREGY
jgi:ParB family chromosome partitioning protein